MSGAAFAEQVSLDPSSLGDVVLPTHDLFPGLGGTVALAALDRDKTAAKSVTGAIVVMGRRDDETNRADHHGDGE